MGNTNTNGGALATLVAFGIVGAIIYGVFRLASGSANTPALPPAADSNNSIEYKIACVDAGAPVDSDGPQVMRVEAVLHRMEDKFKKSDIEIGDQCVAAHNALVNGGVTDESIVSIMEHVEGAVPPGTTKDLAGCLTLYVALRTKTPAPTKTKARDLATKRFGLTLDQRKQIIYDVAACQDKVASDAQRRYPNDFDKQAETSNEGDVTCIKKVRKAHHISEDVYYKIVGESGEEKWSIPDSH